MELSADGSQLLIASGRSGFLLKPQTSRWSHLPENEHLSMLLAARAGLRAPPFGLLRLADGSLAYLVRRFDRSDESPPRGLRKIDLCQLADKPSERKAEGSAEECARLVAAHTRDPRQALLRLFELFLVSYWLGNGDLHLKNISLLEPIYGAGCTISPIYDVVSTSAYYPDKNPMLLSIDGRRANIGRTHFVRFGAACRLSCEDVEARIDRMLALEEEAIALLRRSLLPRDLQVHYERALKKRTRALRAANLR
ncbi:MAG: HipA domain-containing protein [Nannocystis sp.]|nr:HipA domain-containing protein [Nannocystis sp.]